RKERPDLTGERKTKIEVHEVISDRRGGKQRAWRRQISWMKRQQVLGPITFVEDKLVCVLPRGVADVESTAFADPEIEVFIRHAQLVCDCLQITEIHDLAATLDCFAKLVIRCERLAFSWVVRIRYEVAKRCQIRRDDGVIA